MFVAICFDVGHFSSNERLTLGGIGYCSPLLDGCWIAYAPISITHVSSSL